MTTIEKLKKILLQTLGEGKVVTAPDLLDNYSRDETSGLQGAPDIVVRAACKEDVVSAMAACREHNVPVTPRGAGTGVTGGAVPVQGGVVLSVERMNRIIEIDRENLVAVVEPGVITAELQNRALELGLFYPPDPASLDSCSIGGNVAENAGGPRGLKYGTTKDYVLGLEVVLPDGSLISTGGKTVKNATGYNLTGLFAGSEGTLGIITKVYLKLIPAPLFTQDLLIPFDSIEDAVQTVTLLLSNGIFPATIEFMEEDAIQLVTAYLKETVPFQDAKAHLLVQLDGDTQEGIYQVLEKITKIEQIDSTHIYSAQTASQKERLWKTRRSIRESIRAASPVFFGEDCVVPRVCIPEFLKGLKQYFCLMNVQSVMFGHAGDGNVHINVLKGEMDNQRWKTIVPDIKKEIYTRAVQLGGTITGEHGIGVLRKDYITIALSEKEIELSKKIKAVFDPQSLLNPGKIF